jgi:hypothetical protein
MFKLGAIYNLINLQHMVDMTKYKGEHFDVNYT